MIRAVIDENTPRQLATLLRSRGFDVSHFPNAWKGTRNGRLLDLAEAAGFTALISCDQSIAFQQDLRSQALALIVLPTNKRAILTRNIEPIASALRSAPAGRATEVDFLSQP